jgi:hypothetical protein
VVARKRTTHIAKPIDPTKFTPHFDWHGTTLQAEGVALADLADKYGTPTYIYSRAAIESAYRQYQP